MIGLGLPSGFDGVTVGGLFLCDFDPLAGPTGCVDVSAKLAELAPRDDGATYVCFDAGIASMALARRFEPPTGDPQELVVLCSTRTEFDGMVFSNGSTLYRLPFDLSRAERLIDVAFADAFQVGDATGDGIDDIVVREGAFQAITIYRQCTSRDRTCGFGTGAEPSVGGK